MLLALLYQLVRYLTDLALVRTQSDAQLRAEVLALRHQLRVLERKVGKPAWQPGDRLLLAALRRLLWRSGSDALLLRPETGSAGTASWSVQVGRLCRTPSTARFCSASRATGAGLETRSGEPARISGHPAHEQPGVRLLLRRDKRDPHSRDRRGDSWNSRLPVVAGAAVCPALPPLLHQAGLLIAAHRK